MAGGLSFASLLELLRYSLGLGYETSNIQSLSSEDWKELVELAWKQGVLGIALDGYQSWKTTHPDLTDALSEKGCMHLRMDWFGSVFPMDKAYAAYHTKLQEFCSSLRGAGMTPVVMKGYGLSLDYPVPAHRQIGDIDLFVPDAQAPDVDRFLSSLCGRKCIMKRFERHSHCRYKGVTVENHHSLSMVSVLYRKSAARFEALLRSKLLEGSSRQGEVVIPGADFNALFLMWHISRHYSRGQVTLRQLCDWMMFVKAHGAEVDWEMVKREWCAMGMEDFAGAVNWALVHYLGLEKSCIPALGEDKGLSAVIMRDIFEASEPLDEKKSLLARALSFRESSRKIRLASGHSWVGLLLDRLLVRVF